MRIPRPAKRVRAKPALQSSTIRSGIAGLVVNLLLLGVNVLLMLGYDIPPELTDNVTVIISSTIGLLLGGKTIHGRFKATERITMRKENISFEESLTRNNNQL